MSAEESTVPGKAAMVAPPRRVVVMGVSGCGKTTVGQLLAECLGGEFSDGDALHPEANIAKMRSGSPLDDADREPWLRQIGAVLGAAAEAAQTLVIGCSALRRSYRDLIRSAAPDTVFVHLHGDRELLEQRLRERPGHFMPASLLDSQLATLEMLEPDETGQMFDIVAAVTSLAEQACRWLQEHAQRPVWTLSGFGDEVDPDPVMQVAVLQALGAEHIEVRSAWGVNVADFDQATTGRLQEILDSRGVKVSAIASPIGKVPAAAPAEQELQRLRRVIDTAGALGAKYIRIFSFYRQEQQSTEDIREPVMERLRLFAAEAEAAGVVLVHENEKDIYGDTPQRVLDIMETVDSPALRVAWDNANFVQVGVRPYTEGYALLRPYLEYFQIKDALASTGEVVPSGEGDGQLRETIRALAADGFTGFASLEPHLAEAHELGGFSGPAAYGRAARAFRGIAESVGVQLD